MLFRSPAIVIADEPVAHLDAVSAKKVVEVFDRLHQLGATIIVTTHQTQYFEGVSGMRTVSLIQGSVSTDASVATNTTTRMV